MRRKIKNYISKKTKINHEGFLNAMLLFKYSQMATNMRCCIVIPDRTIVPCNIYSLALARSGFNKGMTMSTLEKLFKPFSSKFKNEIMVEIGNRNIQELARKVSERNGSDFDEALTNIIDRFNKLPAYEYSFKKTTDEGLKGLREKLNVMSIGANSFEVDEIGFALTQFNDTMDTFFEIYDLGITKPKLIKSDQNRDSKSVPANLIMFGTPNALLNAGIEEEMFYRSLENGMARRIITAYVESDHKLERLTPEEEYERMVNEEQEHSLNDVAEYIESFAHESFYNKRIEMTREAGIRSIAYRQECQDLSEQIPDIGVGTVRKPELEHRYWRAIKIAGLFAFMDKKEDVDLDCFEEAIQVCEESGKNFERITERPPNWVRLANFIMDSPEKVTQHEIAQSLQFYKGSKAQKEELVNMATAYAYTTGGVIKRKIVNEVDFFEGEKLKETKDNQIIMSISQDKTYGFENVIGSWENLSNVICTNGWHYSCHHYKDGHRRNENALERFNIVILDVDDGISLEAVKKLLEDRKWFIATTKSHRKEKNDVICDRFRIVFPLKYEMVLSSDKYSKFMKQLFKWIPFEVDEATCDAARKYESFEGEYWFNDGEKLDPVDFIENTEQNKKINKNYENLQGTKAIERWLLARHEGVGRNNTLIKYGLLLVDNGLDYIDIENSIFAMNDRFDKPLAKTEILNTVLKTIGDRIHES